MAAGHRPCGQCRQDDYRAFAAAWTRARGDWPGPKAADIVLHAARAIRGARMLGHHVAVAPSLPDGAFYREGDRMALVRHGMAIPFGPDGYERPGRIAPGPVEVLTSPPMLDVLRGGYVPRLHPSLTG